MPEIAFYALSAAVIYAAGVALVRAIPLVTLLPLGLLTLLAATEPPRPFISWGGISTYPADLLAAVLAGAALFGARRIRVNLTSGTAALVLVGLLAFNVMNAIQRFGTSAIVEARPTFYLISSVAYFLSLDLSVWRDRLLNYTVVIGLSLSLLAIWRWSQRGLGNSNEMTYIDGVVGTSRVLLASQALVVASAAIVTLWRSHRRRSRHDVWFTYILLAVVVISQQRSVWAASLMALGAVMLMSHGHVRRRLAVMASAGVGMAAMILVTGALDSMVSNLVESAQSVSLTSGTLAWRVEGWRQLVHSQPQNDLVGVLVGRPFGSSLDREIAGQTVSVSAHSLYVSTYLRAGLLGVAVLALLMVRWFTVAKRSMALPLAAAIATYGVAYSIDYFVAPVVALLCASNPDDLTEAHSTSASFERIRRAGQPAPA